MTPDKRCYKNNTRWFNVKAVYYRVLNCGFERDLAMASITRAGRNQKGQHRETIIYATMGNILDTGCWKNKDNFLLKPSIQKPASSI
jgi:hypothetical protein